MKRKKKVARSHEEKEARVSEPVEEVLTNKQLRFVEELLKDGNATQAAIRAGFSKNGAAQSASRLLRNVHVKLRLEQLRAPITEQAGFALQDHVNELARLRALAEKEGQLGAAINAEVARGRALGHQSGFRPGMLEELSEAELEMVANGKAPRGLKLA